MERMTMMNWSSRRSVLRVLVLVLLVGLLVPMAQVVLAPAAQALMSTSSAPAASQGDGDDDEDANDYSLYQLASNASSYFSNENSPENDDDPGDRMGCDGDDDEDCSWRKVTQWPGAAGSLLGYADADSSLSLRWLTAGFSGSSQTVSYSTFSAADDDGEGSGDASSMSNYEGLVDYVHFGAANSDLGLDTTTTDSGFGLGMIGGSIIWFLYAIAIGVSAIFYGVILLLKIINPFRWFFAAVKAINPELAEGMTQGSEGASALSGLSNFIANWYGVIVDLSWLVIMPLFLASLLVGLVLFKKMNRGRAIKRFVVRLLFIGLGLPILGSLYTQVLNQFDDSMFGQHSGPTRVVLSTFVDFEAWMTNDRLLIPEDAVISWEADNKAAGPKATLSVRTTALAINAQSNPNFSDMTVLNGSNGGGRDGKAKSAWQRSSLETSADEAGSDVSTITSTFGLLNRYIYSDQVEASDFESGIKSTLTQMEEPKAETKRKWFTDGGGYEDAEDFGTDGQDTDPHKHPIIVPKSSGLNSNNEGGTRKTFQSNTEANECGRRVWQDGGPAECNMSPLAAYNYLNTKFGPDSLTMYSSDKATSGFQRESHASVSLVGTGPASFMYWVNTATLLAAIVVLGVWYGFGMFAGSVKRTFSLVAAIPFATLGAMGGISKVIIYSVAMTLEVLVTLFLYQLVSEFLISLPGIFMGPVDMIMNRSDFLGDDTLGAIVVVILTFLSTALIVAATFALLRARKVSLQALDEAVTKMVDRFLETDTPPPPGGGGNGGMMPSLGRGIGAGAGMAAASRMGGPGSFGGSDKKPSPGGPGKGQPGFSSNAGGTNGPAIGGRSTKFLGGGSGGDKSGGTHFGTGGGPQDSGGGSGRGGFFGRGRRTDKQAAADLRRQGGLSNLGYNRHGSEGVIPGQVVSSTTHGSGVAGANGGSGRHGISGVGGRSGQHGAKGGGSNGVAGTGGRPGRRGIGSTSHSSRGTHFGSGRDGQPGRSGANGQRFGVSSRQIEAGGKNSTASSTAVGQTGSTGRTPGTRSNRSSATNFGSGKGPGSSQTRFGAGSADRAGGVAPGSNKFDRSKTDLTPLGNQRVRSAAGGEQTPPDKAAVKSMNGPAGSVNVHGGERMPSASQHAVADAAGGEQRFPLKGEKSSASMSGGNGRSSWLPPDTRHQPRTRGAMGPTAPKKGGSSVRGPVPSPGGAGRPAGQVRGVGQVKPTARRSTPPSPPPRPSGAAPRSGGNRPSSPPKSSTPKPLTRRTPTPKPKKKN